MKKIYCFAVALVLTAALLALFSGCRPSGPKTAESADGIVVSDSLKIFIEDVVENETELTARLGEPVRRQESQSCIAVGTDINLDYEGFSITLYPHGESAHVVGSIKITSSKYATATGIRPGDNISSLDSSPYTLRSHYDSVNESGTFTYFMGDSVYFLVASVDDPGVITRLILGSSEFTAE